MFTFTKIFDSMTFPGIVFGPIYLHYFLLTWAITGFIELHMVCHFYFYSFFNLILNKFEKLNKSKK